MTKLEALEKRIDQLGESQGSSLWPQVFAELTPQERMDMRGFLNAMKNANWADNFDFATQLKHALSGLVSEAEHAAMLKAWTRYRDRVGLEVKTESITKLLDLLDQVSTRKALLKGLPALVEKDQVCLAYLIRDLDKENINPDDFEAWLSKRPEDQQALARKVLADLER